MEEGESISNNYREQIGQPIIGSVFEWWTTVRVFLELVNVIKGKERGEYKRTKRTATRR